MKCCKQKKGNKFLKSIGIMGICCLLPIIVTLILPALGLSLTSYSIISILSSLICPIMMGGIFFVLLKPSKNSNNKTN